LKPEAGAILARVLITFPSRLKLPEARDVL